jgi:hypothetical protein
MPIERELGRNWALSGAAWDLVCLAHPCPRVRYPPAGMLEFAPGYAASATVLAYTRACRSECTRCAWLTDHAPYSHIPAGVCMQVNVNCFVHHCSVATV